MDGDACPDGEPRPEIMDECKKWADLRIDTRVKNANELGLPFIMTEFGACLNSSVCVEEISAVVEACDRHRVSWTYWQFKKSGDFTTSAFKGS